MLEVPSVEWMYKIFVSAACCTLVNSVPIWIESFL